MTVTKPKLVAGDCDAAAEGGRGGRARPEGPGGEALERRQRTAGKGSTVQFRGAPKRAMAL